MLWERSQTGTKHLHLSLISTSMFPGVFLFDTTLQMPDSGLWWGTAHVSAVSHWMWLPRESSEEKIKTWSWVGKESRSDSWIACCPWRALSYERFMNGRPEECMPISTEIIVATGYKAMRNRRSQAERTSSFCGYKAVGKEQLCPGDLAFCLFFFLKSTSCLCCFHLFWWTMFCFLSIPWCYTPLYPPLNCSSSIFVMMGLTLVSWYKISGCSQTHGIHDTMSDMWWQFYASQIPRECRQLSLWLMKTSPVEIEKIQNI